MSEEIKADVVRVGPLVITTTPDGGAGIWIDRGPNLPMVAIFSVDGQAGIGLYGPNPRESMPICLTVDKDGSPAIQFSHKGEVLFLGIDAVRKICEPNPGMSTRDCKP